MAKLGIQIDIDYSKVNELKKNLKNIPVTFDTKNSNAQIDSISSKIKKLKSTNIDIKVNTSSALSNVKKLEASIANLKNQVSKGLDFKLDFGKATSSINNSVVKQARAVQDSIKEQAKAVLNMQNMQLPSSGSGRLLQSLREQLEAGQDLRKELSSLEKVQLSVKYGEDSKQNIASMKQDLKEMDALFKSISKDEVRLSGLNSASAEFKAIQRNANATRKQLDDMSDGFKKTYGASYYDTDNFKKINSALNANARVREAKIQDAQSKQYYRELESSIKQVGKYKEKLLTAGDNEAKKLREIISLEEKRQSVTSDTLKASKLNNVERDKDIERLRESVRHQTELKQAKHQDRQESKSADDSFYNGTVVEPRRALSDMVDFARIARAGWNAGKYMVSEVRKVDDQLINIAKVLDDSEKVKLKEFADTIFDTASTVGKSADEYGVSVERWATAGHSLEESIKLARFSSIGSFVGNIGEADMVKYMSVPLKAFQKDGIEATDILNVMNEVANNNAIEMDDLGKAYQRAAGSVSNTGTTFSQFTGLVTGAQEQTRLGGEKIGTALKTMAANFGKMSSQLESGDKKNLNLFKDLGIDINDAEGNLKSVYSILDEIHSKWGALSSVDKTTLALKAAGKHHQDIFFGIMNGWDTVKKSITMSESQLGVGEAGSAFKEFAVQQESLSFKVQALSNAWSEFINVVSGGKDVIGSVLSSLTSGLQMLTDLAKVPALRSLGGTLLKITGALTGLAAAKKGFQILTPALQAIASPITNLFKMLRAGKKDVGDVSEGVGRLSGGFKNFSGWLDLAIIGLPLLNEGIRMLTGTDGLGHLDNMWKNLTGKKASEAFRDWVDSFNLAEKNMRTFTASYDKAKESFANYQEIKQSAQAYEDLASSYEKLHASKQQKYKESGFISDLALTTQEFEEFQEKHNKFVEELGLGTDLNITFNNHDHIMEQIQGVKKAMQDLKTDALVDAMVDNIAAVNKATKDFKEGFEEKEQKIKNDYKNDTELVSEAYNRVKNSKDPVDKRYADNFKYQLEEYERAYKEKLMQHYDGNIEKASKTAKEEMSNLRTLWQQQDELMKDVLSSDNPGEILGKIVDGANRAGEKSQATVFRQIDSLVKFGKSANDYRGLQKSISDIFGSINESNIGQSAEKLYQASKNYSEVFNQKNVQDWLKDKNMSLDFNKILSNTDLATDFFNNVLPKAIGSSVTQLENAKQAIAEFGREFGVSTEKAEELIALREKNEGAYLKEIFNIDEYEASKSLGLSASFTLGLKRATVSFDEVDTGTLMQKIHDSVQNMDDIGLSAKVSLRTASGDINYDKIVADLNALDAIPKDIQFKVGIRKADGTADFEQIYSLVAALDANGASKTLGIDLKASDGFQQLMDAVKGGEISIKVNEDGGLEFIKQLEDGTEVKVGVSQEDIGRVKTELESIKNEKVEVKANVDVEMNTLGSGKNLSVQEYWKYTIDQIKTAIADNKIQADIPVDTLLHSNGEPNMEAIARAIESSLNSASFPAEVKADLMLHYDINKDGALDMTEITNYLNTIWTGSELNFDKEVNVLLSLLSSIQNSDVDEKVEGEVTGKEYEGDGTVDMTATAGEIDTSAITETIEQSVANITGEAIIAKIDADTSDAESKTSDFKTKAEEKVSTKVDANTSDADSKYDSLKTKIETKRTAPVDANTADADAKYNTLKAAIETQRTAPVDANTASATAKVNTLVAQVTTPRSMTVHVNASISGALLSFMNGTASGSISVHARKASVGVALGKSFSSSVGSSISGKRSSANIGSKRASNSSPLARVNEDVWRYWVTKLLQ
ncbi:phage tail tape measure protein [Aerococcaceae bacterium zg-B36]|uniref:phage tail tape measure protein n=1 Tax=Aerococcaceae bacterium zg-252 TaxID=2796928 RepID=UPI001BD8FE40|nr:phage tail tape measure protein [Aerococcaceae bacterium zg-B36]